MILQHALSELEDVMSRHGNEDLSNLVQRSECHGGQTKRVHLSDPLSDKETCNIEYSAVVRAAVVKDSF